MFNKKLDALVSRYLELRNSLANSTVDNPQEFAKLSKEYSDILPIAETISELRQMQKEEQEAEQLLTDSNLEQELKVLAKEELIKLKDKIAGLELQIKILLLPKDEADERNAILEVRAGTGGEEAGLFAARLLRMYQRYAANKGWRFELISTSDTGIGAVKEASAIISGRGVFARLKFESGVHRVQRVPETEASGRIHTSTATVAVLPEAEDVDIHIDEKDLQIDVYRASGAGGQHVNTTDSAVRITHLPSGVVVTQQDERSQHKNKAKALKILRAKLYEAQRQKQAMERASDRKNQVGTGERSERIRTYNFPQGRVSDHRINLTLYKIEAVVEGEALDDLIEPLIAHDQAERMMSI
jgi:peptide chain release factor 1